MNFKPCAGCGTSISLQDMYKYKKNNKKYCYRCYQEITNTKN